MNIMQYRAIKAQEAQQASAPAPTQVQEQVKEQPKQEPVKVETKPIETPATPVIPEKINIEGVGEVTIDELKNGYLRQTDYTKKTQEVAKQRKESEEAVKFYETVKQNPQLATEIQKTTPIPATLDPVLSTIQDLRNELFDMKLEKEIETLQKKYPDFEIVTVLDTAREKKLTNLEDAYLLTRKPTPTTPVDVNKMKEELRQELLKELEAEKDATQTIITPNGSVTPIQDNTPQLSESEKKVANMMFRNVADPYAEYLKWKNPTKRK